MNTGNELSAMTLGCAMMVLGCPAAMAQDAPAETARTDDLKEDGGDIVVTARLREERLQQVPLAITAFTAKQLDRQRITDMASLAFATAGLQMDSRGGKQTTTPVIRGLSQVSRIDDENNTPVFIDGVYVSGSDGVDSSLLDVERIEVVKGPQSSLYGRNSYAGSINYVTRKAGNELEGSGQITAGDGNRLTAKASISGPIINDVLFARVAGAVDRWDGSYGNSNLRIGGYTSKFASGGVRLLLYGFEAIANVYYADDDIGPSPQYIFAGNCETIRGKFGAWCGAYPTVKSPDMTGYDPRGYGVKRQTMRSSLTMKAGNDDIAVTSITGYNTFKARSLVDFDRQFKGLPYSYTLPNGATGSVNLTGFLSGPHFDNYDLSQEIRFGSAGSGPLQWTTGASYYMFRSKADSPYGIDGTPAPDNVRFTSLGATFFPGIFDIPAGPINESTLFARFSKSTKSTKSMAAFGAAQYTFGDAVTVRGELRYTTEQKRLVQIVPSVPASQKTFSYWTPRFTMDYQAGDTVLVYASAARGAKAGGFNSAAPTTAELPFGPEFNWTYEIGVKSDWFENRLRVNLAVFNVNMQNIQISASSPTNPGVFITQNAGTGRSRGFELEVVAQPARGLTLQGAYSLADARFVDARDGTLRTYPSYVNAFDVSGNALPRQAKHLVNLSAQYEADLAEGWDGYIRFDGRYESQKNGFTVERLGYVQGRTVVNGKVGVIHGAIDASVWVRNLFNDATPILATTSLTLNDAGRLPVLLMPDLRTIGGTISYRF